MSARKRYRITTWQRQTNHAPEPDYWIRREVFEVTGKEGRLLGAVAGAVGLPWDWCNNKMHEVNDRMVAVETLP